MTREEFDTNFTPSPDEYQKCSCGNQMYDHMGILMYINSLEKTIKNLEQHIAELEAPKTCDGCEYYDEDYDYNCSLHDDLDCKRKHEYDYYKPKGSE